jgi:hypothetical protein
VAPVKLFEEAGQDEDRFLLDGQQALEVRAGRLELLCGLGLGGAVGSELGLEIGLGRRITADGGAQVARCLGDLGRRLAVSITIGAPIPRATGPTTAAGSHQATRARLHLRADDALNFRLEQGPFVLGNLEPFLQAIHHPLLHPGAVDVPPTTILIPSTPAAFTTILISITAAPLGTTLTIALLARGVGGGILGGNSLSGHAKAKGGHQAERADTAHRDSSKGVVVVTRFAGVVA